MRLDRLNPFLRNLARRVVSGNTTPVQNELMRREGPPRPVFPGIRVAIIGAGRIAHHHLDVLKAFEGVHIVGLCNRGGTDISEVARAYAIERTFSDWRAMVDKTQPDAIFILVSPSEVATVAAGVLGMGIPCLIEKPAGLAPGETAELARLAAKNGCLNMVGVNRRYYSVLENALIAIHERGPLTGVSVEAHEPLAKLRANSRHSKEVVDRWTFANSIHPIDLFRRCAGDVLEVEASLAHHTANSRTALLRTKSGALGSFVAHWDSVPGWRLRLYGYGVRVTLDPIERGEIEYSNGVRKCVSIDEVDVQFKAGFYYQDLAFLESLLHHEPILPPGSDLADQVKTMQLIERIFSDIPSPSPALDSLKDRPNSDGRKSDRAAEPATNYRLQQHLNVDRDRSMAMAFDNVER